MNEPMRPNPYFVRDRNDYLYGLPAGYVPSADGPTILLHSGNYLDLLAPHLSHYTVEDIAWGLSAQSRFAGQTDEFYSIAQHCVLGSRLVEPQLAFDFLMHDAAEGLIHDISRPLKNLLPDYRLIEDTFDSDIARRWGIGWPMHPAVKECDNRMLATERRALMSCADDWPHSGNLEPYPEMTIVPWKPRKARNQWLKRFHELYKSNLGEV